MNIEQTKELMEVMLDFVKRGKVMERDTVWSDYWYQTDRPNWKDEKRQHKKCPPDEPEPVPESPAEANRKVVESHPVLWVREPGSFSHQVMVACSNKGVGLSVSGTILFGDLSFYEWSTDKKNWTRFK